ncbi:hypothetical protein SAMN05216308_10394 [Nitrosospira sp. Nsp13]|nr:hypothetical protein SAMN05216308_10394 [Nitrosospira sp. Nsp13]
MKENLEDWETKRFFVRNFLPNLIHPLSIEE